MPEIYHKETQAVLDLFQASGIEVRTWDETKKYP